MDFPVDTFDLCSPFTHALFLKWAPVMQASPQRGPGSCRWSGAGVTATITDETGKTLAEISNDPRYRPGHAGFEGNRYWITATRTTPPYSADLFLAAGPAQPRRLLHVHVETETERVRVPRPDQSVTAGLFAEFIAGCIDVRMTEVLSATTGPAPMSERQLATAAPAPG